MKSLSFLLALFSGAALAQVDHSAWNDLLQEHVTYVRDEKASVVDYRGFQSDRESLQQYLDLLAKVSSTEFDAWSDDDQLAFLINAYNAWTVELILTKYPNLESIKDIGSLFSSPWKKKIANLLGKKRTLDDIEHGLIRGSGRYNEPRIHVAVNCASVGCPALRKEAYEGAELEVQLELATRKFLSDETRNRFRIDRLEISSVFKWYRDDFDGAHNGATDLAGFLLGYADALELDADAVTKLKNDDLDISFLDYDWSLNVAR